MKPVQPNEQTIFNAARELSDPEKRAAYLDLACGKDTTLRNRIERLLKAEQRADQFLGDNPIEFAMA